MSRKNNKALLQRLYLLCLAMTLAGCATLGPDYEPPEVDWLGKWQLSAEELADMREEQAEVDLRFWWRLFGDPVLDRLIELAKLENPSLRIAGLRILESRAVLGIAGSTLYPQLQQASGSVSSVNTRQSGGSQPSSSEHFASYQASVNLSWELDFWGRFKRGIESADAAFFASVANQQNLQVLISAQVAELYFAYRTTEARIAIAEKNIAIQKRSYEITETRFKSGEESELDLQQAKTQYLATLSSVPQLELALTQTRNALGALLGRAPGDMPELAAENYQLPVVERTRMDEIPARLLARRPDIRAAALQVAAQSAQIGIAEADYYPAISLLGTIGWSGSSLGGSPDTGTLSVGPTLRWNIFDYGRIENNIRVQDARLQQLIEAYQETVLQAAREIDDAGVSTVKTAEQQSIIDESVRSAERALEIANTRYREGYADFQRVLDAQRAFSLQAESQVINQGSHISAVIGLYKSLGGGWIDMPVEQLIPEEIKSLMQQRSDWGDLLTAPIPDTSAGQSITLETTQNE